MKQRVSAPAPQPIRGLRNAGHTVRGIRQRRCSRPINNFLCAAQSSSAGVCIRGRQNRLAGGLRGCNHRQSSSIFPCSFPPYYEFYDLKLDTCCLETHVTTLLHRKVRPSGLPPQGLTELEPLLFEQSTASVTFLRTSFNLVFFAVFSVDGRALRRSRRRGNIDKAPGKRTEPPQIVRTAQKRP